MAHAGLFRAPPETCYRAARGLDLLRDPVVRTLLGIRALPQRITNGIAGHRDATAAGAPSGTFRLGDMVGPPLGWILLGEEPGVQIVLGQIGRPWKPVGASEGPPVAPTAFASFDGPGFAKIAFSLWVQPHGPTSSLLIMETRVALTDPQSLRRFRRYWRVAGPFIRLIDRMTLRLLGTELRGSSPAGASTGTEREVKGMVHIEGEIVIDRPVEEVFDFVADERNEPSFNPQMRRAEKVSDGPIGPGTRFRAEMVSMGRPVEMEIEFTGFERPRRLASTTRMSAMDIQYTLTFDPVPAGTRMRWSGDLEPRGILKLMSPMVARMGRRQEQRIWTGLKRFLEAGT